MGRETEPTARSKQPLLPVARQCNVSFRVRAGPVTIVRASRVACENRPVAGEARKAYRVIRLSASTNRRAIFAATRRDAPLLADCRVARRLWTFSPQRSSLLALGQNRQRRSRDDYGNKA